LDRRSADQRFASAQVRTQPLDHGLGDFLIDPTIMLEREKAASNPGAVRLVPYAPVPVTHSVPAPLLNAATHDVCRSVSKRSNRPRIVERRRELSEGDHWLCAHVQNGLHVRREYLPLVNVIRGTLVEQEQPDQAGVDLAKSHPDALARRPHGEVPTLISL